MKGQARTKVDVNIYRAVQTSVFGVGLVGVTLDPYSAAAEGGILCACEVVQSGKPCHWTAFVTAVALIPAFDFTGMLGWFLFLEEAPGIWTQR